MIVERPSSPPVAEEEMLGGVAVCVTLEEESRDIVEAATSDVSLVEASPC
jgi:hypothetical protein